MASILKVDTIQDQSGNNIINENADTITIGASGDTVNVVGTLQNNGNNAVGITEADQWRLTATTNTSTNADVTTNWERVDNTGWSGIGTGLTESSGIFTFTSTGIYLITFQSSFTVAAADSFAALQLQITTDNSTYNAVAFSEAGNRSTNGPSIEASSGQFIFDVTNITTHKFKFSTTNFLTGTSLSGNTDYNRTAVSVIRIGDT